MLADNIKACHHMLALCAVVSHLHPVGSLEGRDVRVMSTEASDTIPISLISDKFIELIALQPNFDEEHVDHQKTLDIIKRLNEGAFTELQKKYFEQNLEAYLSDRSAEGNKQAAVESIRQAFYNKSTELILSGLSLNKLPNVLGQLTQLQALYLAENRLTELPETLWQLTQLQTLNLARNELSSLPNTLGELMQLQRLNLGGSAIRQVVSPRASVAAAR